jgi:hypothetical protein
MLKSILYSIHEGEVKVVVALQCPFCRSEDVSAYGALQTVKSGMPVIIRQVLADFFEGRIS